MKTVLVTGASRGLGLAIMNRLLEDPAGFKVVGTGRSRTAELETLLEAYGERAAYVPYDLSNLAGIPELVTTINETYGAPWALINNAALGVGGVLSTMHRTDIESMIAVNLTAPILLTKFVSRKMLSARSGRIVNISSIIARTGFHGLGTYAATKAGMEGLTRSLARELGKRNITVNCVAPGFMETEMTSGYGEDQMSSIRRRAILGLAHTSDVAAAVAYLLSPDAARVTGTVMTIDGGSTA